MTTWTNLNPRIVSAAESTRVIHGRFIYTISLPTIHGTISLPNGFNRTSMNTIRRTYSIFVARPLFCCMATLLVAWYVCILTVLPIANYWRTAAAEPVEAPVAEASYECTGMACSIDDANGNQKGCCCDPSEPTTPDRRGGYQIGTDCSTTGSWDIANHRSPASHAPAFAGYQVPAFASDSRHAAMTDLVAFTLSYPIDHVPILQCA